MLNNIWRFFPNKNPGSKRLTIFGRILEIQAKIIYMQRIFFLTMIFIIGATMLSCHKKNYPARTVSPTVETTVDSAVVKKPVVKKKQEPLPKVIAVNDEAAHKSVDGRLYYDVMGHRYWKNYRDGKYYLFDKSMFSNPDFKAPK